MMNDTDILELQKRQHPNAGDAEPATYYAPGVPRSLHYPKMPAWGLLDRAYQLVPQRTAVEFLGHTWSYTQIHYASLRLAGWLQQRGLEKGQTVGVLLPNCPEYTIALPAVWRAGGTVVSLSPLSVAEDIERLVRLTGCQTMICLDVLAPMLSLVRDQLRTVIWVSLAEHLPAFKAMAYLAIRARKTGSIWFGRWPNEKMFWDAVREGPARLAPVEIEPDRDPAYVLGTSGTTGASKAVTLSHRNLVSNAWQQMFWAGATMGEEVLMAVLPFFHSYGMSAILNTGFALGATLIVLPRFHPRQTLRTIQQLRPTVFHTVPAILTALNEELRKQSFDLSSLKWVISGGAALDPAVGAEFAEHSGAIVVEGYGLSEASPVTHVGPLDGESHLGTIGLPLPDTYCRIVDPEDVHRDLPTGEIGELLVKGPQVMLGYWENPKATHEALVDGWLRTGDLAKRDEKGFYYIVDRKKDLIITSGFNVYPSDVEKVIGQCSGVAEVAVIGVPDPQRGEVVKAIVRMAPGYKPDQHRLEQWCTEHLAAHMRPRQWEFVEGELPRNFLGKVLRRKLKEDGEAQAEQPTEGDRRDDQHEVKDQREVSNG